MLRATLRLCGAMKGNIIIRLYLAHVFTTSIEEELRAARRVVEIKWLMPRNGTEV